MAGPARLGAGGAALSGGHSQHLPLSTTRGAALLQAARGHPARAGAGLARARLPGRTVLLERKDGVSNGLDKRGIGSERRRFTV